jgi:hypothetical protein
MDSDKQVASCSVMPRPSTATPLKRGTRENDAGRNLENRNQGCRKAHELAPDEREAKGGEQHSDDGW